MAVKLLKFVIALALMPLVAGEIWTLIDLVPAIPAEQWWQSWFVSFGAGLVALKLLTRWLAAGRWQYFGIYCLVAAGVVAFLANRGL